MLPRSLFMPLAAVTLGVFCSANALAQTALDDILAKKTITIAIPTDYPPYGTVDTEMKPKGSSPLSMATNNASPSVSRAKSNSFASFGSHAASQRQSR